MENLKLNKTVDTPEVFFDFDNGVLSMEGKLIPESIERFYLPVNKWISEYLLQNKQKTIINLKFFYLNSTSNRYILDFLRTFEKAREKGMIVQVNWYYEENDELIQETGELYEKMVNLPFKMIEF